MRLVRELYSIQHELLLDYELRTRGGCSNWGKRIAAAVPIPWLLPLLRVPLSSALDSPFTDSGNAQADSHATPPLARLLFLYVRLPNRNERLHSTCLFNPKPV